MKILVSAYACEPGKGSEPRLGWRWAMQLTQLGHEVWILTRANNRPAIEPEVANVPNLHFLYYDLPYWIRRWKKGGRFIRLYYTLWQWRAYQLCKQIHEQVSFDLVHHVTLSGIRYHTFMGGLGIPFILGPVGGGEYAPLRLRRGYGLHGWLMDALRDGSNLLAKIDPLIRRSFKQATRIVVTSEQTLALLPPQVRYKVQMLLSIGWDEKEEVYKPKEGDSDDNEQPFRVLYIGRLVHWKGMHLGIPAFAQLLRSHPNSRLTIRGTGREERRWRQLASKLDVADRIDWIDWLPENHLSDLYTQHDVLLFPSLHDSGGMVVMEALSCGLPVVCLSLGGPSMMVNDSCGRVIKVDNMSESSVIQAMGDSLAELAEDRALRHRLGEQARQRCHEFSWGNKAKQIYAEIIDG